MRKDETEGGAKAEAEGETEGEGETQGEPEGEAKGPTTISEAERPPVVSHERSGAPEEGAEK